MTKADVAARARQVIGWIPVEALRAAVIERDGATPGIATMSGADLRTLALRGGVLSNADVVDLFEQWRYGRGVGLTIAIFTKRPKKPSVNFAAQVSAAIDAELQHEGATKLQRERACALIGQDVFDDGNVIELPFKYGQQIHYLDMSERPQAVTAIRFGFAWAAVRDQFLAVAGDAGSVSRLLSAIAQALDSTPIRVSFDKGTMDKHFDLSKITSILQEDLERGIRTRVSGEELYLDEVRLQEIKARDETSLRLGARYREDLEDGSHVAVGVNAKRSRIHTTRGLSSTQLREWAIPKITEVVHSLLELQKADPIKFCRMSSGRPLEGVPRVHADLVRLLAAAVATCRDKGMDILSLDVSKRDLADLPKDAGRLVARVTCRECADVVLALCDVCLDSRVLLDTGGVRCAGDHESRFVCESGHMLRPDELADGVAYQPDRLLLEWVSDGLGDMGQEAFDPSREHFRVRATDFVYIRKGVPPSGEYAVLYMDIEGSTNLQHKRPIFKPLLRLTRHALGAATKANGGRIANDTGDGGFALFPKVKSAVAAACAIQNEIATSPLNTTRANVRIGIAVGAIDTTGRNFEGSAISLAARLQATATKGARIAVDATTAFAVKSTVKLTELGRVRTLNGFADAKDEPYFLIEDDGYAQTQNKSAPVMSVKKNVNAATGDNNKENGE